MQKLKEMIEKSRNWEKTVKILSETSSAELLENPLDAYHSYYEFLKENDELKNQIIEILMESGECEWIRQRGLGINCSEIKNENKTYDFISCRYCQGQEKINKLLEGER